MIRILIGVIIFLLLALVLWCVVFLILEDQCRLLPNETQWCIANWRSVPLLRPNEIGDALAGVFAPLAFIVVVISAYFQWLDRNSLALQRSRELRQVDEREAGAELLALLERLKFEIEKDQSRLNWAYFEKGKDSGGTHSSEELFFDSRTVSRNPSPIADHLDKLISANQILKARLSKDEITKKPESKYNLFRIEELLSNILTLYVRASPIDKVKIDHLCISQAKLAIVDIMKNDELWETSS